MTEETNDKYCEKIKSIQQRNNCYIDIVKTTKDIGICNKIELAVDQGTTDYQIEECKKNSR